MLNRVRKERKKKRKIQEHVKSGAARGFETCRMFFFFLIALNSATFKSYKVGDGKGDCCGGKKSLRLIA